MNKLTMANDEEETSNGGGNATRQQQTTRSQNSTMLTMADNNKNRGIGEETRKQPQENHERQESQSLK
jgi:hypothetical protein